MIFTECAPMVNHQSLSSLLSEQRLPCAAVAPAAPIMAVASEMVLNDQAIAVVMHHGKMLGMVTRSDVLRYLVETAAQGDPETTVSRLMTKPAVVVDPGISMDRALSIMDQNRTDYLPVVKQGRLIGIVQERDLLRGLLDALQSDCRHLQEYIEHLHHAGLD